MGSKSVTYPGDPSADSKRRRVRSILENYTNPWDILCELVQNSVDAIRRWNRDNSGIERDHVINIIIDKPKREIIIQDTGSGFSNKNFLTLLNPDGTDKGSISEENGEKGVGLKFCIFSSDFFELKSKSVDSKLTVSVDGAHEWLNSDSDESLKLEHKGESKSIEPCDTFTSITISGFHGPYEDEYIHKDFFHQSVEVIEYYLLSFTSAGQLSKLFNRESKDIEFNLFLEVKSHD